MSAWESLSNSKQRLLARIMGWVNHRVIRISFFCSGSMSIVYTYKVKLLVKLVNEVPRSFEQVPPSSTL